MQGWLGGLEGQRWAVQGWLGGLEGQRWAAEVASQGCQAPPSPHAAWGYAYPLAYPAVLRRAHLDVGVGARLQQLVHLAVIALGAGHEQQEVAGVDAAWGPGGEGRGGSRHTCEPPASWRQNASRRLGWQLARMARPGGRSCPSPTHSQAWPRSGRTCPAAMAAEPSELSSAIVMRCGRAGALLMAIGPLLDGGVAASSGARCSHAPAQCLASLASMPMYMK